MKCHCNRPVLHNFCFGIYIFFVSIEHLFVHHVMVNSLSEKYFLLLYTHPREGNKAADFLPNLGWKSNSLTLGLSHQRHPSPFASTFIVHPQISFFSHNSSYVNIEGKAHCLLVNCFSFSVLFLFFYRFSVHFFSVAALQSQSCFHIYASLFDLHLGHRTIIKAIGNLLF